MKKTFAVILYALILSGLSLTAYADECNHDWYSCGEYKKKDNTSHFSVYQCYYCGATKDVEEAHNWDSGECIRMATVFAPAIIRHECSDCGAKKDTKENYNPKSENSIVYIDLDIFPDIYRTSKSVTVCLYSPLKGGVIQLKIGKKTYEKTIKNNSTKIKIKIKKPKWGKKFTLKLKYKGKTIYSDWFYVYYAKKLKKGFTKKQAEYTWGWPDDTASASGGWSFWYYEDGSYIGFKNGRVKYWYKA